MKAIIIHGMGRTPLAMCLLAYRLRKAGIKTGMFAYSVTFERWIPCLLRLQRFIGQQTYDDNFIVVGHSLGTVLARTAIPSLDKKPMACFFLAPPTQACFAARLLASRWWYRLLAGEMGQMLANPQFMDALPIPSVPIKIYNGDAGHSGKHSPFKGEANDGVLTVKETLLPGVPYETVPSLHTFIMNNRLITKDIIETTKNHLLSES